VTDPVPAAQVADICDARRLFPATAGRAYFNTAAVGLASRRLAGTYHEFIDEWAATGLDYSRGEQAGDEAPLDGIEELLVALHDIRQILSRPALARLAKIERVAEEVASAAPD